ncbi:MAG: hypothetical protein K8F52_04355 [Candidatus Scalindua rubra]|uniref:DUF5666 domain-containing protein n=1 Tax=Candidatus Scalindua brodae TaxID=237368 RepID=A0A0B0EGC9_9BACT|nr:MAG: hypothetical protein SCABRO_02092 [Candidatus Scalindua brodae]MBZ0107877.1 hypothetical protein [Candidatus Scalindua rubra]
MYGLAKSLIVFSFLGVFLFGLNAYAHTQVDLSGMAGKSTKLAIIEGKIKSIDLEKMIIVLEECDPLGHKALMLTRETECYLGNNKTDIESIRDGTEFDKRDELGVNQLSVGDHIKCNYSRKVDNIFVVRIVKIINKLNTFY